ncbi:DUF4253 domain-containing protein [Kitasatospora sp. NPDC101176]|uniref:DUF4253 domain-containing protein n=1 Tax=Kitasatospora sp. NPDC101176 TaxID=3364099 RepID=UPI003818853C
MTQPQPLPPQATLPVPLPPGRPVAGEQWGRREPYLWISDDAAPAGLWQQLHRAHPQTGLWPLLLVPLREDGEFRPWLSGELSPEAASDPSYYDPAALLRTWWRGISSTGEDEDGDELFPEDAAELQEALAPFGPRWPGPAPAATLREGAAGSEARALADVLQGLRGPRLGLVGAASGAEALVACGWRGPTNHEEDTAKIAAVLADWERRFGAQVVQVGFDTLDLSVAAPPTTPAEALRVAAEHTALCPDLVFQGTGALTAYAEELVGSHHWSFWWD